MPAHAQRAAAPLDEVVVTATRTETALQRTPMSLQAFSGEDLELAGIRAGRDLGIMVPNVVLNPRHGGERESVMTMRGLPGVTTYVDGVSLGTWGFLQRGFVDLERVEVLLGPQGTLFGRNTNGGAIQLVTRRPGAEPGGRVDVQLGEFARRAITAAVDWPIAPRLKSRWTAAADTNDGFLENRSAPFALGAENDRFLRADLLWEPAQNASLRFTANGERLRSSDARAVRISNPNNSEYIAYNVLAGNPDYLSLAQAVDPSFGPPPIALAGQRYTAATHEPGYPGGSLGRWQTRSGLASPSATFAHNYGTLTAEWHPSPRLTMRSLTSHGVAESMQSSDWDASEFTLRERILFDSSRWSTQELHLAGNYRDDALRWLLGFYYQQSTTVERQYRWSAWEFAQPNTGPNPGTPGPPGIDGRPLLNTAAVDYVRTWGRIVGNNGVARFVPPTFATADLLTEQDETDRAVFGQVTLDLRDAFDLTVGFRVTTDDGGFAQYTPAEAFRPVVAGTVAPGDLFAASAIASATREPDFGTGTTPRVSLGYRPTDELYVYASYAEGFTSNEVVANPLGPEPIVLDPEVVATRELGLRSEWLDDRLRFNATVFESLWDGLRVLEVVDDPDNPGQPLGNVRIPSSDGLARTQGVEIALRYLPTARWELELGLAILDADYLDIGDPPANGTGLQPGIPLQLAPAASLALGARYRLPLADGGQWLFAASYGWRDDYERALASDFQARAPDGAPRHEPAYGLLNARTVYQRAGARWRVSLFGTNLTDQWYVNGGFDVGLSEGYDIILIGRRRELGVGFEIELD